MRQRIAGVLSRGARVLGRPSRHTLIALVALTAVLIGSASVVSATHAAFTATTTSPGNTFGAGSVTLADNDAGSALFSPAAARPGDSFTSCIQVTYTGSLPALVRMYGTVGGTGLAPYLDLTVTRGSISSGGFGDCTNFTPDATNHLGQGAGVIYSDTLGAFPTTVGGALTDPRATSVPEVWSTGETHAYRFTATLRADNAAQGLTATADVVWQAVNTPAYAQVVLSDGPVGYWRLNETGGTTAIDATGNGHHGTYTNGPTVNRPSGVTDGGTAVSFDGNDDAVLIPYAASLNPSTFSVEAWVKPTGGSGWGTVAGAYRQGPVDEGFGLWAWATSQWHLFVNSAGGETAVGAPLATGAWAHLVGTYDGTTMRLYVDGQLVSSAVHPHTPNTAVPFVIGAISYDGSTSGDVFTGSVDEVAVYDRALTAQEVLEHHTAGQG